MDTAFSHMKETLLKWSSHRVELRYRSLFCLKSTSPVSENLFFSKKSFEKEVIDVLCYSLNTNEIKYQDCRKLGKTNKQTNKTLFYFFLLVPFNFYPSSVNRGVSREPKLNKRSEVFNHLHQHGNDSASTSTSHDKVEVARWMCSCQLPLVWNKIILNQNRWHIMLLFLKGSPNSYKGEKPRKDLASWGFHLPSHAIICTI